MIVVCLLWNGYICPQVMVDCKGKDWMIIVFCPCMQ